MIKNISEFMVVIRVPMEAMPKHRIPLTIVLLFTALPAKFAEIFPFWANRQPVTQQPFIFFLRPGSIQAAFFETILHGLAF